VLLRAAEGSWGQQKAPEGSSGLPRAAGPIKSLLQAAVKAAVAAAAATTTAAVATVAAAPPAVAAAGPALSSAPPSWQTFQTVLLHAHSHTHAPLASDSCTPLQWGTASNLPAPVCHCTCEPYEDMQAGWGQASPTKMISSTKTSPTKTSKTLLYQDTTHACSSRAAACWQWWPADCQQLTFSLIGYFTAACHAGAEQQPLGWACDGTVARGARLCAVWGAGEDLCLLQCWLQGLFWQEWEANQPSLAHTLPRIPTRYPGTYFG